MANKNMRRIHYSKYLLDSDLYIYDVDDYFEELTGYSKSDIKNLKICQTDLLPKEDRIAYMKEVLNQTSKTSEAYIEHRLLKKDGTIIYVYCLGTIDNNTGISTIRIFKIDDSLYKSIRDRDFNRRITDLKQEAKTDDLTGLLRREPYTNGVNYNLGKYTNMAFMIIDIDDFKNVNDTYGHQAGDEVLINISNILTECVDDGLICRLGGDEFSLVLFNIKNKKDVVNVVKKIIKKVNSLRIMHNGKVIKISVSIGIKVMIDYQGKFKFDNLYSMADESLYQSKTNGKNTYTFYK